mmetsp:Transcript_42709/g.117895  ORF Transcript_42709/g.117895 Transcript_42709/m.117895 type:complete len:203 (-) Transcript_42709:1982-2590(-)
MLPQKVELVRITEAVDDARVCFQGAFAKVVQVLDPFLVPARPVLQLCCRRLPQHFHHRRQVLLKVTRDRQGNVAEARHYGGLDLPVDGPVLQVAVQNLQDGVTVRVDFSAETPAKIPHNARRHDADVHFLIPLEADPQVRSEVRHESLEIRADRVRDRSDEQKRLLLEDLSLLHSLVGDEDLDGFLHDAVGGWRNPMEDLVP